MAESIITGIVGLGQMGLPVCRRMATIGSVLAFDLSAERRVLAAQFDDVTTTDTLSAITECTVIVLSLPTPAISRSVVESLLPGLAPDSILIETSTVLPSDVRGLQHLVNQRGVRVIDAAILSGGGQMQNGAATLLVGGEDHDLARVHHILNAIGPAGIRRFGGLGTGMAAKVVNNGVAHAVMVLLAEAFALSRTEQLPLDQIFDMLAQPDGGLLRPLTHRIKERVGRGDYDGGMPLEAARKDSALVLALAQSDGVPLFAIQGAHTVYELAVSAGLGRQDYAVIATLWENWIGTTLRHGTTAQEEQE